LIYQNYQEKCKQITQIQDHQAENDLEQFLEEVLDIEPSEYKEAVDIMLTQHGVKAIFNPSMQIVDQNVKSTLQAKIDETTKLKIKIEQEYENMLESITIDAITEEFFDTAPPKIQWQIIQKANQQNYILPFKVSLIKPNIPSPAKQQVQYAKDTSPLIILKDNPIHLIDKNLKKIRVELSTDLACYLSQLIEKPDVIASTQAFLKLLNNASKKDTFLQQQMKAKQLLLASTAGTYKKTVEKMKENTVFEIMEQLEEDASKSIQI
jgi:hypothetical protein